jgi:hypothetical protein
MSGSDLIWIVVRKELLYIHMLKTKYEASSAENEHRQPTLYIVLLVQSFLRGLQTDIFFEFVSYHSYIRKNLVNDTVAPPLTTVLVALAEGKDKKRKQTCQQLQLQTTLNMNQMV